VPLIAELTAGSPLFRRSGHPAPAARISRLGPAALAAACLFLLQPAVSPGGLLAQSQAKSSAEVDLGNSYRYYQLGRYADSIEAARAALKQRRDYAPAWNNIAAGYIGLGLWDDAITAAELSIRLQPGDNQIARNNLAWAKLNLETTPESYVSRSLGYFQHARYEQAIEAAREALRLRPDYAEAWNNIAASDNCLSRFADAIQAAERALRLKPDFELAKNNLALARSEQAKHAVGSTR
jgi:protein O-mannosyl-transferase